MSTKLVRYDTRLMTTRDACSVLAVSCICGGAIRSTDDADAWCSVIGSWGIVVETEGEVVGYVLVDSDSHGLLIRDLRALGGCECDRTRMAVLALFAHVIDCFGKRRRIQALISDAEVPSLGDLLRLGGMRAVQYRREAGLWLYGEKAAA